MLFDEYVYNPVILRSKVTKDLGAEVGSNDEIATSFHFVEGLAMTGGVMAGLFGETRIERI